MNLRNTPITTNSGVICHCASLLPGWYMWMHVDALYVPRTDNLAEKETNPLLKCKEATTTSHELYMCMYMRGQRNDKCKEKGKGMG